MLVTEKSRIVAMEDAKRLQRERASTHLEMVNLKERRPIVANIRDGVCRSSERRRSSQETENGSACGLQAIKVEAQRRHA